MTERPGSSTREDGTVSWGDLIEEAESRLRRAGLDAPAIDARRIVEEVSGFDGARLTVERSSLVTQRAMARYDDLVARRAQGEPLQYVLGHWAFRTLDLMVDPRVLIPRPETEMIVDLVSTRIDELASRHPDRSRFTVVDLGTGSGAIALAIASERTDVEVWATDRSVDALAVARANLAGIGRAAARVRLAEGQWFAALDDGLRGRLDVVVSNPPYVTDDDPLPAEVERWEPAGALRAGRDGLDDLGVIVSDAPRWLASGGYLVVELDPRQSARVAAMMNDAGFVDVRIVADLVGRDRFVSGQFPAG